MQTKKFEDVTFRVGRISARRGFRLVGLTLTPMLADVFPKVLRLKGKVDANPEAVTSDAALTEDMIEDLKSVLTAIARTKPDDFDLIVDAIGSCTIATIDGNPTAYKLDNITDFDAVFGGREHLVMSWVMFAGIEVFGPFLPGLKQNR